MEAVLTVVTVALKEPWQTSLLCHIPSGGDVLMVGAPIKEKAAGIMFPQLCNGMNLVGMYFYSLGLCHWHIHGSNCNG
jgi:hypothetical protein